MFMQMKRKRPLLTDTPLVVLDEDTPPQEDKMNSHLYVRGFFRSLQTQFLGQRLKAGGIVLRWMLPGLARWVWTGQASNSLFGFVRYPEEGPDEPASACYLSIPRDRK